MAKMKKKQIQKALRFFEKETLRGEKNAIKKMTNDGFDGVNYHKVFAVDLSTVFASAPTPITRETSVGKAKLLGVSATDFPTVAIATTSEMLQNGGLIGIGVETNLFDAQKAMNQQSGLIAKESELAFKYIEEAHHSIAWGTDTNFAKSNLLGFYTHPHIARSEFVPNGEGSSTKWKDKTSDEIITDIADMVRDYFMLNPLLREGNVKIYVYMPYTLFDLLTLAKITNDKEKSVYQYLKKFLPENGFNIEISVASALATKDEDFVAIGDFRESAMSYEIPLTTEGMDSNVQDMLIRKNYIAESKGLRVEKDKIAIIYTGA
jgi:hypothetical protein